MRSPNVLAALVLVTVGGLAACNSLLGINPPLDGDAGDDGGGNPSQQLGDCVLNSDCDDDGQVCLFRVCSLPCLADEDCVEESRCLATTNGTACVKADQATCAKQDDCPAGSTCSAGLCRTDCSPGAGTCLSDQLCTSEGVCRGTDPARDPAPAPSNEGDPCTEEGVFACSEFASAKRITCTDGKWTAYDNCPSGTLCNNASEPGGRCDAIHPDCVARKAGESFCADATRKTCNADRVGIDSSVCATTQHCLLATAATCLVCVPNELRCNSAGDTLEVCNLSLDGFTTDEPCGEDLCDEEELECDVCAGGAIRCVDGDTRGECAADGQSETEEDCPATATLCVGAGECIGALGDPCEAPSDCDSNFCADGFCCESECTGACQTCAAAGAEGQCGTISFVSDPDNCGSCGNACAYDYCASSSCQFTRWGLFGIGSSNSNRGLGTVYGQQLTVGSATTLRALGIQTSTVSGTVHVRLALYRDSGGAPQQLVAQTGELTATANSNLEGAVTATALTAGNYWLFALHDATLGIRTDGTAVGLWWATYGYGSFPATLPPLNSQSTSRGNFYVVTTP